ncbi:MAG: YihD family protein [Enterobacterales bacterium endosymbiont of Blomia tropicalis]|uniref:YihD family protein n=1 Tax=Mixta mediterraneensis TaxID=2758443 RepID=UPI0018736714|nr:YihD family protein [Mixta mediterraneensis]MBE5253953.1 YihD family protein [Mixta mediterraneensis]MDL4913199.1 YihD family protein [Mixta mediterraneensis]
MKCHRLNELMELLQPAWQKEPDLNLVVFLQKLAQESGFSGPLSELPDDVLIYHLKMRDSAQYDEIPGLKKVYEADFKMALLRARGVIKDGE